MIFLDISCNTPKENILLDEALLFLAEHGSAGESLRVWESDRKFIVLGRTSKIAEDINIEKVCSDNIPVLRRSSGGGTVLQGPGCLNYSLVLSKELHHEIRDLRSSYKYIFGKVISALKELNQPVQFAPISDLVISSQERKISGNAQKRGRNFILHHGTLLYNFDFCDVDKYLCMPRDVPKYRRGRGHLQFLSNLPLTREQIKNSLKKQFELTETFVSLKDEHARCLSNFSEEKDVEVDVKECFAGTRL